MQKRVMAMPQKIAVDSNPAQMVTNMSFIFIRPNKRGSRNVVSSP
jgi:hypothetical protein